MRNALLKEVLAIGFVLALATSAAAETSGVVDGELRVSDRIIKLTHVYAMVPFQFPDAQPEEDTSEGLILILGDREYPGDLPPIEIDMSPMRWERPFNGAYLELNRRTGAVLYSRLWYPVEENLPRLGNGPGGSLSRGDSAVLSALVFRGYGPVFTTIKLTDYRVVDGVLIARISAIQRRHDDTQLRGFHSVTPIDAHDVRPEASAAGRGVTDGGEVILDATVNVSILPKPRLLKTLHGLDARASDIAKVYADFLVAERERQIAALKETVAAAIRDEATSKRLQERYDEMSLDTGQVGAIMARLEKLYLYDSRAVLRFRTSSIDIDNVLIAARTGERPVTLAVVRSSEGSIGTTTTRLAGGATVSVTRSHESTVDSGMFSIYAGSLSRPLRRTGFIDVHMVKDRGMWRPSTDQWPVY